MTEVVIVSNDAVARAMRSIDGLVYDAQRFARVFDLLLETELQCYRIEGEEGTTLTEEQVENLLFLSNKARVAALKMQQAYDKALAGEGLE